MSGTASAFLVAGVLLVAAGLIAWRTWWVRRTPVVWMREADSRITHAVRKVELRAGTPVVGAVGLCGSWPMAELTRDNTAERCAVCMRAVAELERGGPEPGARRRLTFQSPGAECPSK